MQSVARHDIERLDSELLSLEAQRSNLVYQLDAVKTRIKETRIEKAKLAPVNTVPDDVLKLILEEAYQHPFSSNTRSLDLCYEAPGGALAAALVCRRWRRTALALPGLWTCIHTDALNSKFRDIYIERSKTLPLQLLHTFPECSSGELINFFIRHAPRWKCVQLGSTDLLTPPVPFDVISELKFPRLEYLVVASEAEESTSIHPMLLAPAFHNLKHLAMDEVLLLWDSHHLRNLHTLFIGSVSLNSFDLRQLAGNVPHLVELTVEMLEFDVEDTIGRTRVAFFPYLRSICFIISEWEEIMLVMDAPNLQTLRCSEVPIIGLSDYEFAADENPDPHRIYPLITHISLERGTTIDAIGASTQLRFFSQVPNLTSLDLVDCTRMSQVFKWLRNTIVEENNILLPKLESVKMTKVQPSDFATVTEFARRRRQANQPLRELKLRAETVAAMGSELVQTISRLVTVLTVMGPTE